MPEQKKRGNSRKSHSRGKSPGRPKKGERVVTPEILQKMSRLFLQGRTRLEIAVEIDVAEGTVSHHLDATIKPLWRNSIQWDAAIEVARADEIIRLAFEGYHRSVRDKLEEREKQRARKAAKGNEAMEQIVEKALVKSARDGDKGWLELVLAAMDFKAKVKGGYAPKRLNVKLDGELRVAGMTPEQVEQQMLGRIAELITERRAHRQIIDQAARNAGEG